MLVCWDNLQLFSAIQVYVIFSAFQMFFTTENSVTKWAKKKHDILLEFILFMFLLLNIYMHIFGGYETLHASIEIPCVIMISFISCIVIVCILSKVSVMRKLLGVSSK